MAFQRPSAQKFMDMMLSDKAKIYVGPERKLYNVPRDLLCYHSPFLNRHFTEKVCTRKESTSHKAKYTKNGAADLLVCTPEQFDMLLECMMQGTISKRWNNSREAIEKCMALISYSDELEMGALVCEVVVESLCEAIKSPTLSPPPPDFSIPRRIVPQRGFTNDEIKVVFKVSQPGNALRALIAQDALSRQGLKGTGFLDSEINVPGFAAEVLKQFRKSVTVWVWTDPITGLSRTCDGYT